MGTTLNISTASPHLAEADAVVVPVVKGPAGPLPGPGSKDVDGVLGGSLAGTLATLGATGDAGEVTKIAAGGRIGAPLLAAVGIGALADAGDGSIDPETLRRAAGAAVRVLTASPVPPATPGGPSSPAGAPTSSPAGAPAPSPIGAAASAPAGAPASSPGRARGWRIALALPARDHAEAEAVALGALLGSYTFRRYRPARQPDPALTLLASGSHAAAAAERAQVLADAVTLTRDLVNTSPSDLVPAAFAAVAERVAAECGLGCTVLDEQELAAGGYGGLIGVGKGSAHPPRLVRLEHAAPGARGVLVLAGKGITFDSGGLSLKPAKAMETMKADMAGAAAVLGALQAIARLGLPVKVIGYLPLAENMPSGSAQRPSDVLTIYGGTTVEVANTDAEGRLVLADALARAGADSPDVLIDVATLTGAQRVALGSLVAGVMGNDDQLRDAVADAARRAGEGAWPMPLPAELRKTLDSAVADLVNVSPDRNAGMLVAGVFLREFVPEGVRWAHLDIAAPSFNTGPAHGYTPKGGTGVAARTLIQVAQDMADGRL